MSGKRTLILAALAVFILAGVSGAGAASFEHPYIYKSPRAMGMGGANVAIGGGFDSIFYNPAGLGTMPENNWEVNIIGLSGTVSENARDFGEDMQDAFDVEDEDNDGDTDDDELRAINEVLSNYRGENMHLDTVNLTSVANNYGQKAFGVGLLSGGDLNIVAHQGIGSEGLLEVNAIMQYGGIGGLSYEAAEGLHLGAAFKYIRRETVNNFFSVRELSENEDDLDEYITDELKEDGGAVALDAGVLYAIPTDFAIKPSVGMSFLNIGDLDFREAGEIPMTVNVGVAAAIDVPFIERITVGVDYADLFNGYEQDTDFGKRVRLGCEVLLFDNTWAGLALRGGLYQGYPTFGAELRLTVLKVTYATYAEEVGAFAGQDQDRRHLLAAYIGW